MLNDETNDGTVVGLRMLCWVSDRACRGLELREEVDAEFDLECEILEEDIPWLKEFRRHLVNYVRAMAFGLCAKKLCLAEMGLDRDPINPNSAYRRLVMNGFYEAQHTNDTRGYVTSGVAISQVKKMGSTRTKKSLRTLLRSHVERGAFQELQTSRDQRLRHIIPSYQTRLAYETAATTYCLSMARFDRTSGNDAAAGVDNIANMANQWMEKKFKINFLEGKVPPFAWDNRVVGLIDIDEEVGDESDPDPEAVEV